MSDTNNRFLITAVVLLGLIYLLFPILMPFLSAALLAYLGNPLMQRLERMSCPRPLAVTLVFTLIFTALTATGLVIFPMLEQQLSALVAKVPSMITWLKEVALPWAQARFGAATTVGAEKLQQAVQNNIGSASSLAVGVIKTITSSGMAFLTGIANVVLVPVVTFYLLRDWESIVDKMHSALPRRYEKWASGLAEEVDSVLGAFFKGQILVMASLAIIYSVGLSWVGLEFGILIGFIAGIVSFVPYLGLIVGLILACTAAVFQVYDASLIAPVLLVFAVGQVLESVVLTPLLVGDKIGLHPVSVIFAVMAGGQLFGFTGILLALPVAAVLVVFLRRANDQYKQSTLYNEN
ncbi:MAG: AI-2E family transporter [Cycloclasticus sp. symbiont of Poecilosclerida sp. M]|nr:MAG: AI-2E family transporter [Cycloclasticus sp. symbiont of Poecilosclerida sp. M]